MRIPIVVLYAIWGLHLFSMPGYTEPLRLADAVQEALANNPRLKERIALRDGIEAAKWADILPENPELFAEYEGIPPDAGPSSYGERSIGISQTFDFPLTYYFRARRTDEAYREASESYRHVRQQVAAEVTEAFYRILLVREQLVLQQEIVQFARSLYDHAQIKADAGEVTIYEPLRARVEHTEAEARLHELERAYQYHRYRLKLLLGRGRNDSLEIDGVLAVTPIALDADSLKQVAMEHHPALREGLSRIEQRRIEHRMAKTASIPGLSLRYFDQQFEEDGGRSAWGGEIALTLPLWDIAKAPGRIKAAGLAVEAAGWELETMKRDILGSIEEAVKNLTVARDQVLQYQDTILAEVAELVRITERSYAEGEMGYLEVIEALRTMQRARSAHLAALYEYHAAFAALQAAAGLELSTSDAP